MKRCEICDSTEVNDTLEDIGIIQPITHWHKTEDGFYRCNRCEDSIQEVNTDFYIQDHPDEGSVIILEDMK